MKTVAVLVGSLRHDSNNLKFARALEKLASGRLTFVYPDIGSLPHYNDDLWANPPESVLTLKRQLNDADAVIFVTPEYNRSIPGVLKNAIDWASRPYGSSAWVEKPASIIGTTPGVIGTAVAQSQLRSIAVVLQMIVMGQPEVYFQLKPGLITENFEVTDDQTREFLEGYLARFERWIDLVGPQRSVAVAAE